MKTPRLLLLAHLIALGFGLGGLLIALPNPELWAESELGRETYEFGMEYAGSLHIVLGALAMFVFGVKALGWARTGIFFVLAYGLSLSSELIGTGTGWPFGNYAYTSFLGYKVLDHVPFTIPLSWFYMGLASYLLARAIVAARSWQPAVPLTLGLGVWLLIVWDLVLDPAMAHEDLAVRFWEWSETGPYYGMPIQNYAGWAATGFLFMAISRGLWGTDVELSRRDILFPLAIYVANTVFAMALSASVDLYVPIVLSAVLGLLPALLVLPRGPSGSERTGPARSAENPVLRPSTSR
jgi:putative membrane protein